MGKLKVPKRVNSGAKGAAVGGGVGAFVGSKTAAVGAAVGAFVGTKLGQKMESEKAEGYREKLEVYRGVRENENEEE